MLFCLCKPIEEKSAYIYYDVDILNKDMNEYLKQDEKNCLITVIGVLSNDSKASNHTIQFLLEKIQYNGADVNRLEAVIQDVEIELFDMINNYLRIKIIQKVDNIKGEIVPNNKIDKKKMIYDLIYSANPEHRDIKIKELCNFILEKMKIVFLLVNLKSLNTYLMSALQIRTVPTFVAQISTKNTQYERDRVLLDYKESLHHYDLLHKFIKIVYYKSMKYYLYVMLVAFYDENKKILHENFKNLTGIKDKQKSEMKFSKISKKSTRKQSNS